MRLLLLTLAIVIPLVWYGWKLRSKSAPAGRRLYGETDYPDFSRCDIAIMDQPCHDCPDAPCDRDCLVPDPPFDLGDGVKGEDASQVRGL